jgi:hypothetical protein
VVKHKYVEHKLVREVFIAEKLIHTNLPLYLHTGCADICTILHIASSFLRCGLQRNDRYSSGVLHFDFSSWVASRGRGTASQLSESDRDSDRVWTRPRPLYLLSRGKNSFDADNLFFGLVTLCSFLVRSQNCEEPLLALCLSVCLSVFLSHGTTRLPLDGFWWNLIYELFLIICGKFGVFFLNLRKLRVLYMKTFHIYGNISLNSFCNEKCFK